MGSGLSGSDRTTGGERIPSPTEIATACGIAWNRGNGLLTWEGLMELAHDAYRANRWPSATRLPDAS